MSRPRRDRPPHVDRQAFAIPFVEDRQGPKATSVIEGIRHEVERPRLIQDRWGHERAPHSMGDAPFRTSGQIEPQRAVHAMNPLVVPRIAFES